MISASKSITGKRIQNEDSIYSHDTDGLCVYAVADGMGGYKAGEVASSCAIEKVQLMSRSLNDSENMDSILRSIADSANEEVYRMSHENAACSGMGSTLTACILNDEVVHVLNIGDSRLYHIHQGEITQITHDHSYVYALVEAGIITESEALHHPRRNEITKAIGVEASISPDTFHFYWDPDDYLLLCTDGVSSTLTKEDLKAIFLSCWSVDSIVDTIVERAYENGSKDNISAIVIRNMEESI